MASSTSQIQFGVLSFPYQILDVAGSIDMLSCCAKPLLASAGVPESVLEKAIDIQFHHIGVDLSSVELTANLRILPTTTVSTCPRLDYLLIGGPDPAWIKKQMSEEMKEFVRSRVVSGELKKVFTTCTGGMVLAEVGLLDGLTATTNHEGLHIAKELWPQVNWVKEPWVVDGDGGKFWTAGGACVGMQMMGNWVVKNLSTEVAKIGFAMLSFEPKDIEGKAIVL